MVASRNTNSKLFKKRPSAKGVEWNELAGVGEEQALNKPSYSYIHHCRNCEHQHLLQSWRSSTHDVPHKSQRKLRAYIGHRHNFGEYRHVLKQPLRTASQPAATKHRLVQAAYQCSPRIRPKSRGNFVFETMRLTF